VPRWFTVCLAAVGALFRKLFRRDRDEAATD
jgi:hypothetical protein